MNIMSFWRLSKRAPETALYDLRGVLPQNVPDAKQPDDDVYNLGTRRGRVQVDGALSQKSLLPENGTNAKPFLSDMYNNSTRARKRLAGVSLYALRWLLPQNAPDTTQPDDDVYDTDTCRKAESAGNGALSSGEKNFNVHSTYMNFSRPRKRAPETALYTLRGSLLPENGTNAKPFLSDVYNNSTRARKRLAGVSLYGRSMVEMLGVLAIIGVLSVGAISGYQKAMLKYKLNKQTQQISSLIGSGFEIKDKFLRDQEWLSLAQIYKSMDMIPQEMIKEKDSPFIYDAMGNKLLLAYNPRTTSDNDQGIMFIEVVDPDENSCRNLLQLSHEMHSELKQAYITFNNEDDPSESDWRRHYGDRFCEGNKTCLRDLDVAKIEDMCTTNCNSRKECRIWISWQ